MFNVILLSYSIYVLFQRVDKSNGWSIMLEIEYAERLTKTDGE